MQAVVQALEMRLSKDAPVRCEVTAETLKRLSQEASCGEAAAFLFTDAELSALAAECGGLIAKCDLKDRRKELAYYFKRSAGIVAVQAGYVLPGQALRGVRAMLRSLGRNRRSSLCLIGVPASTFAALQSRALAAPRRAGEETVEPDSILRLEALLCAGAPLEVPVSLGEMFVGTSESARIIRKLIVCAGRTDIPVLIEGESGTGKEIVARQIRDNGTRKAGPFIVVNCGAIAPELMESELFGHVKGAFTMAYRDKAGLWTLADKGTLFLDEIGDLPLEQQVKVLRALDTGRYYPVGGVEEVKSDVRIVAATNRDLPELIKRGLFREDLYYRLFSFRIRTYPLRLHKEDIPALARHFWASVCPSGQRTELSAEVLEELKAWGWPGNARELRGFLGNMYAFACGRPVTVDLVRNLIVERMGPHVAVLSGSQDR